jgi:transcriptional regulator GlxA family with amidase domain
MRLGVPLVAGTDPVALGILERFVAQANAELKLSGDPRSLEMVRIAAEPGPVPLWGGMKVQSDALFRDRPAIDVLFLIGPSEADATTPRDEEAVIGYLRSARSDAQHILAMGEGVHWAMAAGITMGRRAVLNHLSPTVRAQFDATLAAHGDPARDGDLWSASDPPRFLLLLLEFFADLGGFRMPDRMQVRMPWVSMILKAYMPQEPEGDDDEGGLTIEDVEP